MKENTKIMLRRESGHWNRRNSNVASSPKKIPLKIATVRMEGRKLGRTRFGKNLEGHYDAEDAVLGP